VRERSETAGSRIERYTAFIEVLIPFVAGVASLVKLFKKPKTPKTSTDAGMEPENSDNLERGDLYAKR
jgi:hypothetical protein